MKKVWSLGIAALSLLIAQPIVAHSIWLEEEGAQLMVMYGHIGQEIEAYDPSKVEQIMALDLDGNPIAVEMMPTTEAVSVSINEAPALVAVSFDNGYWVETTEGWQNVSKQQVEDYISASHTFKYTKALYDWSDALAQPVGLTLEIVPMTNPFEVGVGEALSVQVLYNGEPASGVEVVYGSADGETIQTDANGMAAIMLSQPGLQYVEASHSIPVENDPDTDEISHSSTFTFELQ